MADLGITFLRRKYTIHWYQSLFTVITGSMPLRSFWATLYSDIPSKFTQNINLLRTESRHTPWMLSSHFLSKLIWKNSSMDCHFMFPNTLSSFFFFFMWPEVTYTSWLCLIFIVSISTSMMLYFFALYHKMNTSVSFSEFCWYIWKFVEYTF